jgi:hypothetical protein
MPDLFYSERNLLEAARAGKHITAAEIEVLTDRLIRVRTDRNRQLADADQLREALVIARESLHDLCLERGSTDQYRGVFDGINAALAFNATQGPQ